MHVAPLQHPFGHDEGEQSQTPASHAWPGRQAAPFPHSHPPLAEHALAMSPLALQSRHARPSGAHSDTVRAVTHCTPSQQPFAHVVRLQITQTPASHSLFPVP
jgi:hypothetical protein